MFRQISGQIKIDLESGGFAAWRLFKVLASTYPEKKVLHSGTYQLSTLGQVNLLQTVLLRERRNVPGEKRVGVISQQLGSGSYGYVFNLSEFDIDHHGVPKSLTPKRVVKWMRLGEKVEREVEYQLTPEYLSMRPWMDEANNHYAVMRKMPGESLDKLLDEAYKIRLLTPYQRLSLMAVMIRALREQVHENGRIHRDIKPANIMVDLSDRNHPVVHLIDYGVAKLTKNDDFGMRAGTRLYMSYESHKGHGTSAKSDVYSLGIVFLEILGVEIRVNNISEAVVRSTDCPVPHDFPYMSGVDRELNDALHILIKGMTRNNISMMRCGLDEAEKGLHAIRLSLKMYNSQHNKIANKQIQKWVRSAYRIAAKTRKKMRGASTIDGFKKSLPLFLKKIQNDPLVVSEFVETLGVRVFFGCHSIEDVLKVYNEIIDAYERAMRQLQDCLDGMIRFRQSCLKPDRVGIADDTYHLEYQIRLVTRKLQKMQSLSTNLDEWTVKTSKANEVLNQIRSPIELQIQTHCRSARQSLLRASALNHFSENRILVLMDLLERGAGYEALRQQCGEAVMILKAHFRAAISLYLQEAIETYRLRQFDQIFEHTRLTDAEHLVQTIQQAKTVDELLTAISAEVNQLKTGFFGRSRLRELLLNVVDTWSVVNINKLAKH